MFQNLVLVINTCKNYYSNIKNIIKQINEYDFPKQNILIISGQEDKDEIFYQDNIKIIKVRYSGLHLTSVIYINENIKLYSNIKYWVLLPDTIKFGKYFFINICKYYNKYLQKENIYSLGFINPKIRQTMDMGILHTNHILNMTDYLNKIKTYQVDKDNLLKLKKQLIYDEDMILGLLPTCPEYSTKHNNKILDEELIKFITNDKKDLQEKIIDQEKIKQVYFVLLDLYKFQRNFRGPNAKLIIDL